MPVRKLLTVVAASVGAALVCAAPPAAADEALPDCMPTLLPSKSEMEVASFPAGIRAIKLDTSAGNVQITGATGTVTTTVTSRGCYSGGRPPLVLQVTDGVLSITSRCPTLPPVLLLLTGSCSRSFSIVAPADIELSIGTGAGSLRSNSIMGPQSLVSGSGSVIAIGTGGERVRLSSAAGDVVADAVRAPGELFAGTEDGAVDVTVPGGTYAIDAQSGSGAVTITGVRDNDRAPRRITATSRNGSVRIRARAEGAAPVIANDPSADGPQLPLCPGLPMPLCSSTRHAAWMLRGR